MYSAVHGTHLLIMVCTSTVQPEKSQHFYRQYIRSAYLSSSEVSIKFDGKNRDFNPSLLEALKKSTLVTNVVCLMLLIKTASHQHAVNVFHLAILLLNNTISMLVLGCGSCSSLKYRSTRYYGRVINHTPRLTTRHCTTLRPP